MENKHNIFNITLKHNATYQFRQLEFNPPLILMCQNPKIPFQISDILSKTRNFYFCIYRKNVDSLSTYLLLPMELGPTCPKIDA